MIVSQHFSIRLLYCSALLCLGFHNCAHATIFTMSSPIGMLPSSVTEVGGIVFQARGLNGAVLTSQVAASSLYAGYLSTNPQGVGTQFGFTPSVLGALGGGFAEVAVRITLYDGDSALYEFDYNDNFLQINGIEFGVASNFSNVVTQSTDYSGLNAIGSTSLGFNDSQLRTGFFSITDSSLLANLWTSIQFGTFADFGIREALYNDNYFEFNQGVNGSLSPTVSAVPEPSCLAIATSIFCGVGVGKLRRRRIAC